jgi:hypothetical protein
MLRRQGLQAFAVACVSIVWLRIVPTAVQLMDITQTLNRENAGIQKSLEEQIGAGRGDVMSRDTSLILIGRDPFRVVRRGRHRVVSGTRAAIEPGRAAPGGHSHAAWMARRTRSIRPHVAAVAARHAPVSGCGRPLPTPGPLPELGPVLRVACLLPTALATRHVHHGHGRSHGVATADTGDGGGGNCARLDTTGAPVLSYAAGATTSVVSQQGSADLQVGRACGGGVRRDRLPQAHPLRTDDPRAAASAAITVPWCGGQGQ